MEEKIRRWEMIGRLSTVSVWKCDVDFTLEDIYMDLKEHFKNVIQVKDVFIAFCEDLYWQGYENFLMDYEKLTREARKIVKRADWADAEIERWLLCEKNEKGIIKWKNDLKGFEYSKYCDFMYEGIVRTCRMPDGTEKKIAQGAQIYRLYYIRVDGIIAFDKQEKDGYFYMIHYTNEGEKILLKFFLGKWGWYLFDEFGRYLLDYIDTEEYVNKLNLKTAKGALYYD